MPGQESFEVSPQRLAKACVPVERRVVEAVEVIGQLHPRERQGAVAGSSQASSPERLLDVLLQLFQLAVMRITSFSACSTMAMICSCWAGIRLGLT